MTGVSRPGTVVCGVREEYHGRDMKTAFVILTGRCTRSCAFCFYNTGYLPRPGGELSPEEAYRVLEILPRLGAGEVIFTGGEPLLRRDIVSLLEKSSGMGLRTLLLTNGDLLNRETASLIRATGTRITVSVDTGGEMERLEEIFPPGEGTSPAVTTVFHGDNTDHLAFIYERTKERTWPLIFQPAFIPPGATESEKLSPRNFSRDTWEGVWEILGKWARERGADSYFRYLAGLYRGEGGRPEKCLMGEIALVIDSDGTVYPCFHRRDLSCGQVFRDSPGDIAARLSTAAGEVRDCSCFGEHCVSLFIDG